MKKIRIDIIFKSLPQNKEVLYSTCDQMDKPGYYIITIDPRFSPLIKSCNLVHELLHLVFFIMFKDVDEKKEHIVIEKTEAAWKRNIKKYWEGE